MPGSQELYNSLIDMEVEKNFLLVKLDEEWEQQQNMMNVMLGDRAARRPNGFIHKKNAKPWPIANNLQLPKHLQIIQNAGGLPFCKEVAKIVPENVPEFIINNPTFGKGYLSTYKDYNMIVVHCEELQELMRRRRASCTKSLLEIYNPRRKWKLKPHHKARMNYCKKITKLKDPYTWCKKKCGNTEFGNICNHKRNKCTCILNKWLRNNRAMISGDRNAHLDCTPLPPGSTQYPDEDSPLNNIVKCGKKNCNLIHGSELPWCPPGENSKNKISSDRGAVANINNQWLNEYGVTCKWVSETIWLAGLDPPVKKTSENSIKICRPVKEVGGWLPVNNFMNLTHEGHICQGAGCHNKTGKPDTFEHSNYGSGNEQFQAWTDGKGSCNLCRCDHGTPAWGEICPVDGEVKCTRCRFGYHLNDKLNCVPNYCWCYNGEGSIGPDTKRYPGPCAELKKRIKI